MKQLRNWLGDPGHNTILAIIKTRRTAMMFLQKERR